MGKHRSKKRAKKKGYSGKTYGGVLRDRIEQVSKISRNINVFGGGMPTSKRMMRSAPTDIPVKQGPDMGALMQRMERQRTRWVAALNDDQQLKLQLEDMTDKNEEEMRKIKNDYALKQHQHDLDRKIKVLGTDLQQKDFDTAMVREGQQIGDAYDAEIRLMHSKEQERLLKRTENLSGVKIAQQREEHEYRQKSTAFEDRVTAQTNLEKSWEVNAKLTKLERDKRIQALQATNAKEIHTKEVELEAQQHADNMAKERRAQERSKTKVDHDILMFAERRKRETIRDAEDKYMYLTHQRDLDKEMLDHAEKTYKIERDRTKMQREIENLEHDLKVTRDEQAQAKTKAELQEILERVNKGRVEMASTLASIKEIEHLRDEITQGAERSRLAAEAGIIAPPWNAEFHNKMKQTQEQYEEGRGLYEMVTTLGEARIPPKEEMDRRYDEHHLTHNHEAAVRKHNENIAAMDKELEDIVARIAQPPPRPPPQPVTRQIPAPPPRPPPQPVTRDEPPLATPHPTKKGQSPRSPEYGCLWQSHDDLKVWADGKPLADFHFNDEDNEDVDQVIGKISAQTGMVREKAQYILNQRPHTPTTPTHRPPPDGTWEGRYTIWINGKKRTFATWQSENAIRTALQEAGAEPMPIAQVLRSRPKK
jgi:hypothetical protein